ncbi:tol-pal system-associated acyl-CoA thioesterase [Testudinibacter sp. TR-2022]|uniref:tol-pal system-associated acyl-CoA thioesterase n=1 Tax=Testudinibacter sp. TR-2022 TaxID=2585029 RepID=UPI00111B4085|nr:tol-pal system-associated acyl-CoA thioesterase [Testudinibacter sp. TR-2022]TNH04940.1 tol-pal system-associated acyl-CoA thioesterase [Pasteurellaceae bacterium Phil31]TNH08142.1 tol-pal system-associated acyl-CoA thioesterase [Testudinibacter sp. TR-2022]TNH10806.1 tol-pal system-associated acyl-CoA thioesterase [Testudinibacter sp. TR-2022]TNH16492.1 tol-pal system-associated acyl-CoA thioesterase [Testudinibacter sp. TR-2022]TNH19535.1 tol-pal system-associated acyl-CoA thioesterase [T
MQQMPIRVYYEDTDAGGVVYHARYLHFFERARTEFLREVGFEQQKLLADFHLAFVVRKMQIDYRTAAKLDDALVVETQIRQLKQASIVFEQKLLREDELLSEATVLVATVDLSKMKPIPMPEEIRAVLAAQ